MEKFGDSEISQLTLISDWKSTSGYLARPGRSRDIQSIGARLKTSMWNREQTHAIELLPEQFDTFGSVLTLFQLEGRER